MEPVLWECLRFFAHRDEANAAVHCAPVRWSAITERIAEALADQATSTYLPGPELGRLLLKVRAGYAVSASAPG